MGKEISVTSHVVGYCRPIVDHTYILNEADADSILANHGLSSGVTFADEATLTEVQNSLSKLVGVSELVSPGGPVSNALFSFAHALGPFPRGIQTTWTGPLPLGSLNDPRDPLASLRYSGINIVAQPTDTKLLPRSVCLVGREHGDTQAILVGERAPIDDLVKLPSHHMVLAMISDLETIDIGVFRNFALMTADIAQIQSVAEESLQFLGLAGRLTFLFGTISELGHLGLVTPTGEVAPFLRWTEVVATNGAEPVRVWQPGSTIAEEHEIPAIIDSDGTFLGAGDAYSGAYLAARLIGQEPATSHATAAGAARRASYHHRARSVSTANLTELFGSFIGRASDQPDWHLFDDVRSTAGTTVTSCGNPGVDTLGAISAARWGLPYFAIMPQDRRRDDGLPPPATWDVRELGTPSYRYCTWANVFITDGTILVDTVGSEGSAETRRAANSLNRPLLELNAAGDPRDSYQMAKAWASRHGIRIVNVAGNRERLIDADTLPAIARHVDASLRAVASQFESSDYEDSDVAGPAAPGTVIGIPRLAEVSASVRSVLDELPGTSHTDTSQLVWTYGSTSLIRGKSRDLVRAVSEGRLVAAFVGLDMVLEEGSPNVKVVGTTGLFNSMIAQVGPAEPRAERGWVGAQYPRIARTVLPTSIEVVELVGSAEGWVKSGVVDTAVDTWRTGKTAKAHNLSLQNEIARCPLVLVVRKGDPIPLAAHAILRGLTNGGSLDAQ